MHEVEDGGGATQSVLLALGISFPEQGVAWAGIGPPRQISLDPAHDVHIIPGAGQYHGQLFMVSDLKPTGHEVGVGMHRLVRAIGSIEYPTGHSTIGKFPPGQKL